MQLRFPFDAVVVVAGVPGAGKTTLIRRAVDRDAVRVVDMERQMARWRGLMRRIPASEGWASVVVLDREQAARTSEFSFVAPVTGTAAAATI